MEARSATRFARTAAVLATAAALAGVLSPGAAAGRSLTIGRAESVARGAVLAHPSYRQITKTSSGLVTKSCWRAAGSAVRCSFYAVAPNPCALRGDADGMCAQVLSERRWLVEVRRERGRATARMLKISAGPAKPPPYS
jgi:hypothetical protein